MKKLLAIIFTIALAYLMAYYTTDASENQEVFDFDNNQAFYKIMCFITGETDTTDASALFNRADEYYYYEEYDLAIKDYEKSYALDSSKTYVLTNIADTYLAMNDTTNAISVLEEQVKVAQHKDEVLNRLGEIYLMKGNLINAENYFKDAAIANEYSHLIQFNLCNVMIRKEDYNKALEYIINAINLYGQNTTYLYTRRYVYLKLGQTDLAKADYERILDIDPDYFPDYAEKAKTAKDEGNIQSAIEYYKLALQFDPNNKDYLNGRGWLYETNQQYDSAFFDFDTLVKLYPDYYQYFNRGYIFDRLGRIEEAVEDYTTSIAYKDDYYLAYNNRGYEYYKLKNYEQAEKDYTKSIELKSDYYLHRLNRGLLYYELERYDEAIADYKIALQYKPNSSTIIYDLALAYDQVGDATKAIDYFNEYIRLEGDEDTTTYNYIIKRIAVLSNQ